MPVYIMNFLARRLGYKVKLTADPIVGLACHWAPKCPRFDKEKRKRFWRDYFAARDRFIQQVADTWQAVVPVNGQDGLRFFRPGQGSRSLITFHQGDRRVYADFTRDP